MVIHLAMLLRKIREIKPLLSWVLWDLQQVSQKRYPSWYGSGEPIFGVEAYAVKYPVKHPEHHDAACERESN